MTTRQRAEALNGHGGNDTPKAALLQKLNTPKNIKRIQGLAIQPFFNALSAGFVDMEATLDQISPYQNPADYDHINAAMRDLNLAFMNAGYSRSAQPYWASLAGPNQTDIARIIESAEGCIPALQMRYKQLVRLAPTSDTDQNRYHAFFNRFAAFQKAITGLQDHVAQQSHERDLRETQEPPMCSMA